MWTSQVNGEGEKGEKEEENCDDLPLSSSSSSAAAAGSTGDVLVLLDGDDQDEDDDCSAPSAAASFCLKQLESDPLLDDLKEWDYPIFDLLERYGQRILSAVRDTRLDSQILVIMTPLHHHVRIKVNLNRKKRLSFRHKLTV